MTREEHEALNMTATGRLLILKPVYGTSRFRITYGDSRPGSIPNKYSGEFTGLKSGLQAIKEFVAETWDVAEQNTKNKRRA